jgi:hypothetical protein
MSETSQYKTVARHLCVSHGCGWKKQVFMIYRNLFCFLSMNSSFSLVLYTLMMMVLLVGFIIFIISAFLVWQFHLCWTTPRRFSYHDIDSDLSCGVKLLQTHKIKRFFSLSSLTFSSSLTPPFSTLNHSRLSTTFLLILFSQCQIIPIISRTNSSTTIIMS